MSNVLATVGGIAITEEEVNEFLRGLGQRGQAYNNPEGKKAILGQLVANKLLLLDARRNLYEAEPAFKAELAKLRDNLLISYAADKAVESARVTDKDVEDYYNQNKERFLSDESVNASHILVKSEEEALKVAENNLSLFKREVDALLSEENLGYEAKAELRREFFPTREYDGFTLPAGEYDTLVVTLGDGGGENWWCVMFPQVCVGACSGRLTDTVAESSAEYAKNADKYILKFKVVEIFGRIRKKF